MKKISVVIPVYNSEHSIEQLVDRLIKVFEIHNRIFEIILVDDCSKDASSQVLKKLAAVDSRLQIFCFNENCGQQATLKYGISKSSGDLVMTIDDDLEHQPEDIMLLINEIESGFDVVYGVADRPEYAIHRQLGSDLVDLFFTLVLKKNREVRVSSFRIMNRSVADYIVSDQTPFVYLSAIILKHTGNIGNVKVDYQKRTYGKSNYNFKKLCKLYFNLVYYYGFNQKKIKGLNQYEITDFRRRKQPD